MEIEELDRSLAGVVRVFLDSSVCIAYHSGLESTSPLARHLLGRVADPEDPLVAYMSVLAAAELLVRPIRAGGADLAFMHVFLRDFPNLVLLPVDFEVAIQTATVRALSRLPTPDAILIATALLTSCEAIVSNDSSWQRRMSPLFRQFRWIHLRA